MRSSIISLLGALALLATSEAFAPAVVGPRLALRGATSSRASAPLGGLCMQEKDQQGARRVGASVDADGKSNVWAVEPKMQVQDPKAEDKPNPILVRIFPGSSFSPPLPCGCSPNALGAPLRSCHLFTPELGRGPHRGVYLTTH
jgi:hypothetical protein